MAFAIRTLSRPEYAVMRKAHLALQAFCCLVLAALVALPFAQVLLRDIFNAPPIGAGELTRFLLIVLVFSAYPLVVVAGENIAMTEFADALLPGAARRALNVVIRLASAAASAFIAYAVVTTISANLNNATPTLKIPFYLFLGATLFGFTVAALAHLVGPRFTSHQKSGSETAV
jgi:TRAP-type C4-dicarboxylate transport system permease small subunit